MGWLEDVAAAMASGAQRTAGLGSVGESTIDSLVGDTNTAFRDPSPQGIPATYVDTDSKGNRVTGRSIGETVSGKPYEKGRREHPYASTAGSLIGGATVAAPTWGGGAGVGLGSNAVVNQLMLALEEKGLPSKRVEGANRTAQEHPWLTTTAAGLPMALRAVHGALKRPATPAVPPSPLPAAPPPALSAPPPPPPPKAAGIKITTVSPYERETLEISKPRGGSVQGPVKKQIMERARKERAAREGPDEEKTVPPPRGRPLERRVDPKLLARASPTQRPPAKPQTWQTIAKKQGLKPAKIQRMFLRHGENVNNEEPAGVATQFEKPPRHLAENTNDNSDEAFDALLERIEDDDFPTKE